MVLCLFQMKTRHGCEEIITKEISVLETIHFRSARESADWHEGVSVEDKQWDV